MVEKEINKSSEVILEEFMDALRSGGIQGGKQYAKQLGPQGRIILNAIGLFECGKYVKGSKKPIHQLAEKIEEPVKYYERTSVLDRLVTFLIEGTNNGNHAD